MIVVQKNRKAAWLRKESAAGAKLEVAGRIGVCKLRREACFETPFGGVCLKCYNIGIFH